MSSADQIHVMLLKESRDDIGPEGERYTSVVFAPAGDILVWIGPEKIAQETAVRNISWAHNTADLLHRVQVRAQTPMHSEDLLVNDCSNRKAVEAIGECLPELDVIPPLALIIESINTVDGGAFMVATENEEVFGVLDFVCEEQADGFQRLLASIDVITKEEVVCLWRESTILEQTQQIIVLAVNVTADLDRSFEL